MHSSLPIGEEGERETRKSLGVVSLQRSPKIMLIHSIGINRETNQRECFFCGTSIGSFSIYSLVIFSLLSLHRYVLFWRVETSVSERSKKTVKKKEDDDDDDEGKGL